MIGIPYYTAASLPEGLDYDQRAREGREDEFALWYDQTHARELLAVPGIMKVERSLRVEACPTECNSSPKSLSALHIKAPSIGDFKVGLEEVAKTFTDTTSYDIANAWRLTLQKIG